MIVWLVGLSGAGKTTIGRALVGRWKLVDRATVLVDGDEMRDIFRNNDLQSDYSVESRRANAERMVEICIWLDKQGINAVCSMLCIFPEILAENRTRFSNYFEIFVDAPLAELEKRDDKGLYAAARSGRMNNVVGIDIEFPVPASPHMIIHNADLTLDPDTAADNILQLAGVAS